METHMIAILQWEWQLYVCIAHENCHGESWDVTLQWLHTASESCKFVIFFKKHNTSELVGGFNPSEKYESQLGWWFPIYGKIKNVPNHQPERTATQHLRGYLEHYSWLKWLYMDVVHDPWWELFHGNNVVTQLTAPYCCPLISSQIGPQ